MVARIAKAISLGLNDEETAALVRIDRDTLLEWNKDPEFSGTIKSAVADRMVKRLERIESGGNGWQGSAWLAERLFPTRYAKPEVQISLNTASGQGNNAHVITISLEEAERIEAEAAPIREAARQLLEEYERNRGGAGSPSREVGAGTVDMDQSSQPRSSESVRRQFDQYLRDRR
jgi:hypothetical protein